MRRGLIILGVLVVATLATMFVGPMLIDWDRYRGAIEEEASRLAGREVRIGGKINVRLLPVPYIHIGRLRVADTTAAIGEPLFKADSLTMWLALSPLIGGTIEARRVELTAPVVNLVLDDSGGGNWASLTRIGGAGAALPASIAFDDIDITNGALVVRAPGGAVRAQFLEVAGSVSATALEGPYRVNISYMQPDPKPRARDAKAPPEGARRELRLSTARQDADGSVRFKGTVKALSGGMSWAVDGTAHDLLGRVRVDGGVTARIPFVKSDAASARGWSTPAPAVVEVKSTLQASTESMELADLTLTIDADNKPQLATGAAKFSWRGQTTADILLKARWIDVDRIIGADASTASTATLARIIAGLGDALPDTEQLRALVLLDQATLNGDVISGLKADIQKGADGYEIRELSGNLPGSARLVLSGKLVPGGADTQFEGPVTLRGASFNKFVAWAGRGLQAPEISQDGPFALDTQLTVGPARIGGQDIRLELPGGRLGGDASWTWPGPAPNPIPGGTPAATAAPVVVLALDGPSLDIGALLPSEPRPGALVREMIALIAQPAAERPGGGKSRDAKTPEAKSSVAPPSADIKLRFGRLATRSAVYHDVDAELRWDGKSWHVPRLRAAGASGWRVELEGDIAGIDGTNTTGTIAGVVVGPDSAALTDLLALLEIPATGVLDPQRLGRMSPLRLAGRLQLSPKVATQPGGARLTLDGTVGESRVAATIATPRRTGALNDQPLEIDVRADVPAITTLLAQIAPDGWTAPPSARIAMPARLTFTAVGQLSDGFQTLAALESAGMRGELRGRLNMASGANPELAGTVQLRADDLAHLLAATALGHSERLAGLPVAGRIALNFANQRLKLETDDLALAETRVRGTLDLDISKPVKRIEARIASSRIDLSRILVPILDEPLAATVQTPTRVEPASWWPEAPFDLDRLSGIEGTIALDATEFVVGNGVALRNTRLETAIRQGALDVRLVEAAASGGKASGRFTLAKAPAGVALKGSLRIDGAEIGTAPAVGARPPPVAGRLQVNLDVTGTALTARGLVAALTGTGEVRLSDVVLNHLSPSAISAVSDEVLAAGGTLVPGQLEKLLRERLSADPIALGRRRIGLTVTDGHVRTAPLIAETRSGRISGTTIIDLDSQRIDSEWKLDGATAVARKGGKPHGALPAVTIVWAGPLARLASIEPQVQFDALERELSVRRMEGEVDELERLRRLDEQRARQETERQRLLETERARDADRAQEARRLREAGSPAPAPSAVPSPWQVVPAPAVAPQAQPIAPGGGAAPAAETKDGGATAPAPGGPSAALPDATPGAGLGGAPGAGQPLLTPTPPPTKPAPRPTRAKRPFNPFADNYSP
jgi:hypothetical protein